MPRPIEALIHTEALAHNIGRARESAPDARVWAVVKANAYGHGIERAFEGLRSADGFALLDFDEAQRIRDLGWRGPILMLEGCFEQRDLELCSRLGLWHAVHCEQQIDWLAEHKTHTPHRVFLKLNSGMNRLGFTPTAFRGARARLELLPQVDEISLMTHFSDADGDRGVAHQLDVFEATTADMAGERTLSNSAATLRHGADALAGSPRVRNDWVRAGIMSYGSAPDYPARTIADWQLRPAMTLRSKLIGLQQLQPGDTVGYGSAFSRVHAARNAAGVKPRRFMPLFNFRKTLCGAWVLCSASQSICSSQCTACHRPRREHSSRSRCSKQPSSIRIGPRQPSVRTRCASSKSSMAKPSALRRPSYARSMPWP